MLKGRFRSRKRSLSKTVSRVEKLKKNARQFGGVKCGRLNTELLENADVK